MIDFHHNVDRRKFGLLFEADTKDYLESIIMEIDTPGKLLKTWNMANIISAAMTAGGDDPSDFVFPSPGDWFHSNAVTYNRVDDSLIVSSREDFVICLDYESGGIKWILGGSGKGLVSVSFAPTVRTDPSAGKLAADWAACRIHHV